MQAQTHVDTTPIPARSSQGAFSKLAKRLFDILVAGLGLIFLSPLFGWIAWRVRRDSAGPIFYHGKRSGLNGREFNIHKFRTMREEEQSYNGPPVTAQDDPRITSTGRWLRETKLNELPQFWNVLKGEMSLVGPRPEDPGIVKAWHPSVRLEILSVRPGITSPASVLYRNEETLLKGGGLMDTYLGSILPSKLRLDQLYIRHRSFWLDLDILFWTVVLLLPKLGSFNPPEGLLFLGPFTRFVNRYLSWFLIDSVVSLVSITIAGLFFRSFAPLDVGWSRAIIIALLYALLFSITCAILKVNRIQWSEAQGEDILALLPATILATVIGIAIITVVRNPEQAGQPYVPYGMIFMASLLSFIGFVMVRFRNRIAVGLETRWFSRWTQMPVARERVLVVGGGESGQTANTILTTSTYGNHFQVIGYVDDDLFKQDTRIKGLDVLGKCEDIPRLVRKFDIGIIFFAIHNITAQERQRLLQICNATPARTILFPDVPAALNTLWNGGTRTNDNPLDVDQPVGAVHLEQVLPHDRPNPLPCELCLIKISPMEIDRWLEDLEEKSKAGDLVGLQETLSQHRSQLRPDAARQYLAMLIPDETVDRPKRSDE